MFYEPFFFQVYSMLISVTFYHVIQRYSLEYKVSALQLLDPGMIILQNYQYII